MCRLGQPINHDPNCVMSCLRPRNPDNKIHHDMVPLPLRYFQVLQSAGRSLMFCLNLLECHALAHMLSYLLHFVPQIVLLEIIAHLRTIGVDSIPRVMHLILNPSSIIGCAVHKAFLYRLGQHQQAQRSPVWSPNYSGSSLIQNRSSKFSDSLDLLGFDTQTSNNYDSSANAEVQIQNFQFLYQRPL